MLWLAAGALIPVAGILIHMSFSIELLLVTLYLVAVTVILLKEYLLVRKVLAQCQWSIRVPAVVHSGRAATIQIKINRAEPHSALGSWQLTVRPEYNNLIKALDETLETPLVQSLTQTLEFRFLPLARGTAEWSGFYGRVLPSSRFCFWQFYFQLNQPAAATVLPNHLLDRSKQEVGLQQNISGERKISSTYAQGREFEALRPYAVGDDLRKIDWKRSAKGRGLLLKVYRPETHQRIQLAIDCGRRMGTLLGDRLQLEYAADAAAGLSFLANKNSDEVGLFAFHHQIIRRIGVGRGPQQFSRILQALVELRIGEVESDYQLVGEWAHQGCKRSLLVLITSVSNLAGLQQIGRSLLSIRGRHLPVLFSIADRELIRLSRNSAASLEEAYIIAAAREQLTKIEEQRMILEKSGIPCVYCDAVELHTRLVAKYTELKASGRL